MTHPPMPVADERLLGDPEAALRNRSPRHFDLAVIGTGSGNSIVDSRFASRSVAILEEGTFGGTCLNVGCIPTKMFVYPADLARGATHARDLGVSETVQAVDWPAIRDRIFGRIDPIANGGRAYRMGQENVRVFTGHCRFTGPRTLQTGTGETITAEQVVIAAGSRAVLPDIPGLDAVRSAGLLHTSDTVMRMASLPARLAIIGGGFVAAEFAHVFSAFGVEVTQIHRGPLLLTREDEDVSARFTEIAARQWRLLLETQVAQMGVDGDGVRLRLSGGQDREVAADVVLVATGRVPNSDQLNLAAAGVRTDSGGVVEVDRFQRTSAEAVWALGDVANHHQLKHVANHEARVVQHNLLHPDDPVASDHRFVPSAVFSSPQVASVGLTSQAARAAGVPHLGVTQRYADVAYGWAMEDTDHFVKLLTTPDGTRLLGAHIIGPQASILIQTAITAMSLNEPVQTLARHQYWIHPALTEVMENALLAAVSAADDHPK